jgi:hypothetical protein
MLELMPIIIANRHIVLSSRAVQLDFEELAKVIDCCIKYYPAPQNGSNTLEGVQSHASAIPTT